VVVKVVKRHLLNLRPTQDLKFLRRLGWDFFDQLSSLLRGNTVSANTDRLTPAFSKGA